MPINNFLLPGAKTTPAYEVANSCRFDRGSSASMHITFSGAGDRQKFTFSFWVKRNKLGTQEVIFDTNFGGGANEHRILFDSSDRLEFTDVTGGSVQAKLITNRVFRDPHAWYHIVAVWDTANTVSSERIKYYVNGQRQTDLNTQTLPSQNADSGGAGRSGANMRIGTYDYSGQFFDGYMAELHYTDNYAYEPSEFGELDS